MNQLFKYGESEVRTVMVEGEPWFVAKDVCDIFGETNRNRAMQNLDDDEKGYTQMTTPGGNQRLATVNESGLYSLLFAMQPSKARYISDKRVADRIEKLRAFKRWVTSDVLPAIRKHGGYLTPDKVEEALLNPDTIIRLATQLKTERAEKERLASVVTEQAPKVAAYDTLMWAEGTVSMNEAAKTLGYGRNRLFGTLRERKVLTKENVPYQRFTDGGFFVVVETIRGGKVRSVTRVTPKGLDYMYRELAAS
jgi:prophage antirepressor-like protein